MFSIWRNAFSKAWHKFICWGWAAPSASVTSCYQRSRCSLQCTRCGEQIHLANVTNTFCYLDKYILRKAKCKAWAAPSPVAIKGQDAHCTGTRPGGHDQRCSIHGLNTNIQIHKHTNAQNHKYTNTQAHKYTPHGFIYRLKTNISSIYLIILLFVRHEYL